MLKIDEKYFIDYRTRSNTTTISEVFSGIIIDRFVLNNCELVVGDNPSFCLPDIYTIDKVIGFKITNCEADIDFQHKDITREFQRINFDYLKFIQEKENVNSLFNNSKLKITHDDNKITSSTMGGMFHDVNWMYDSYVKRLKSKLSKLNKGRYSGCNEISLVVLSTARWLGFQDAQVMQGAYNSIINDYSVLFKNIYLFTTDNIFRINEKTVKVLHSYKNDEYSEIIKKMKKILKIHQYAE